MFRFERIELFELLLILLVGILLLAGLFLYMWYQKKKAIERFGNINLMQRLLEGYSPFKHYLKFGLFLVALALFTIGWANPQWGTKRQKVAQKSADVFIALDLSYSMLAEDIVPSRMERAKRFAEQLVAGLKGERLGLITFAGNAYLQTPLTQDYALITLSTRSANPYQLPTQGTAISDAIGLAQKSFDEENEGNKVLVIISDGENHDDEAIQAASDARRDGCPIYTVGVGTKEGGLIAIDIKGRRDYKRDETGVPVRSQLNEEALQAIAEAGGGQYFNLALGVDIVLEALQREMEQMEKREFEQRVFTEYDSYFQYFIGAGLLILLIEFLISFRRSRLMEGKDLFGQR